MDTLLHTVTTVFRMGPVPAWHKGGLPLEMQLFSTNRMFASASRSSTGFAPTVLSERGGRVGHGGETTSCGLLSSSGLAITLSSNEQKVSQERYFMLFGLLKNLLAKTYIPRCRF